MSKRLYVAYGSNLNLRQMAYRCPTAKLFGTGCVENYELQFKGNPHGAFATVAPKEGSSVPVALWEIKPRDEKSLDIYEGYPNHYYKQDVPVNINGQEISAMVYIMNQKMEFGIPSQSYYETVREGYQNCGLDVNVLKQALDDSIKRYYENNQESSQISVLEDEIEDDFDEEFYKTDKEFEQSVMGYEGYQYEQDELMDEEFDENDPFYSSDQLHM